MGTECIFLMMVLRLVGLDDDGVNSNSESSRDLFRWTDFWRLEDRLFVVLELLLLPVEVNIPGPDTLCDPLRRRRIELGDRPSSKDCRSARVTLDAWMACPLVGLSKIGGPKN